VLIVIGMAVGIGTVVIWVGIPILIATTGYVRWFADVERRWVRGRCGRPTPNGCPWMATACYGGGKRS
jgi:hypothetical protein